MNRYSKRTYVTGAIVLAMMLQIPVLGTDVTKALREKIRASSKAAGGNAPAIPGTGLIGFLASSRGQVYLKSLRHPFIQALAKRLGLPAETQGLPTAAILATPPIENQPDGVAAGCGTATGTRFNFDPRVPPGAVPQNGPVVDFLPGAGLNGADLVVGSANDLRGLFGGLGDSSTGYYVHRNGRNSNPCAPDFDGGLPSIADRITGETIVGDGDSAVEADPARSAVFIVDTRLGSAVSTIGLFRNTSANLNSTTVCPSGTHDAATARNCWATSTEVNPRADGSLNVFPQLAIDPRPSGSGTGAGDVYVSNILSTTGGVFTVLSACKNNLSACSAAIVVSGGDLNTQTVYVRVRPDVTSNPVGAITLTYVGSSRVDLQACKLEYSIVSPK